MVKEFFIDLIPSFQRPVINLYGMTTLIDTGAVIPTFSLSVELLKNMFNAKLIFQNAQIGGFGGNCFGDIYSLENFKVGKLIFDVLEVFVPKNSITKHPFLLSSTMFSGMDYDFDTINSKFIISLPEKMDFHREFHLKDLKGKLYTQTKMIL